MFCQVHALADQGKLLSGWSLTAGGAAEGIFKMSLGNRVGFRLADGVDADSLFTQSYGSILVEAKEPLEVGTLLGYTTEDAVLDLGETLSIAEYEKLWADKLESVFPMKAGTQETVPTISYPQRPQQAPAYKHLKPKAVIPVFPGTNCEYDTARAVAKSGGEAEIIVVRNLTASALAETADVMEMQDFLYFCR